MFNIWCTSNAIAPPVIDGTPIHWCILHFIPDFVIQFLKRHHMHGDFFAIFFIKQRNRICNGRVDRRIIRKNAGNTGDIEIVRITVFFIFLYARREIRVQIFQKSCHITILFAEVVFRHKVNIFVQNNAEGISQVIMLTIPYQQTLSVLIFPEIRFLVLIQRIHAVMGMDIGIQKFYSVFDQGIALLKNPAGGLIVQNVTEYAKSLDIDVNEVIGYLALQELAHARLFASVPWLMPRFEALLGKYARGITIDMDAMEEQIREAESIDPDSMASAVNITKVAFPDTPEQKQAMKALENLLALVEGWVDAVVWRAGMAHIPHIEQLREMLRRERAIGGPAERTFESLMGMQLRPKRMREAAALWESIGAQEGPEARDAKWSHPDLLPQLPDEQSEDSSNEENGAASATTGTEQTTAQQDIPDSIDWDAELSKLLDEEEHKGDDADSTNDADGTDDAGDTNASGDPQSPEEA